MEEGRRGGFDKEDSGVGQRREETYGIARCEFLLRTDDVASALGGVDGTFATDDGLA